MSSNNATGKMRGPLAPQRRPGKARVAAVLAAAAAVIAEKGYDAATMAEIAARAGSPIGSLYRFFPNKEILASALIERYLTLVNEAFDQIDQQAGQEPLADTADRLLELILNLHGESRAMLGLLEGRADFSARREEFRTGVLQRITRALRRCAPTLPRRDAGDMAVILLLNMKTMRALKLGQNVPASPGAAAELRFMNRLYFTQKLAAHQAPPL